MIALIRRLFRLHGPWLITGDTRRCTRCGKRQQYVPDCGGWSTGWWQDINDEQEPSTCHPQNNPSSAKK